MFPEEWNRTDRNKIKDMKITFYHSKKNQGSVKVKSRGLSVLVKL